MGGGTGAIFEKKCGEGEGAIIEPKTLSMYLKKEKRKKNKKLTEPGFEPMTSGLEIHYGSETHLREVPIYMKSRIVTS